MSTLFTPEIANNIFLVGTKDWNRRLFDALIPLPQGTSYNSYLIKGEHKLALIDTVNPGFEFEMEEKINQISDISNIDYLIMNHAEPDHAGSIPYVFSRNKKIMLVTSKKGANMAKLYYQVPEERIKIVGEGESLELGNKSLQFIDAPWLHWPETIFTYLVEDKILFPCDFFGSHSAFHLYDDEAEDLIPNAQKYFGEIMMPFAKKGQKAMEKLNDYEINIIAPSHGPIHRHPKEIMKYYQNWTTGQTKEKAIIVYVSMWGSTEKMVKKMAEYLQSDHIEVAFYNIAVADIGDIAKDLVDSRAIVLGTPSVIGGMHPLALYASSLLKVLKPPLKYAAFISSYGWGEAASKQALEVVEQAHLELIGAHTVNGPPTSDDYEQIEALAKKLANQIKAV